MAEALLKPAVMVDPRGGWTSASNAAADERCHGRHLAQKQAPKRKLLDSDDAAFGRKIHEALVTENPEGLDTQQVKVYEMVLDIRAKVIDQVFGGDAPNIKVIKERRFKVGVLSVPGKVNSARFEHSAQLDYLARMGNRLLIIEYKTLPGEVANASQNLQLRDQAVCSARTLVATHVITCVIQPLVTHQPELCEYDAAALTKAENELFARVRNSNNPQAWRTPNPISCKFCTATVICPEYQEWAGSRLPQTQSLTTVPLSQWSPAQRAEFCTMLPVAQKWLDDCKAEMKRLLKESPELVPGFTLKEGAERVAIIDPQQLFDRLVAASPDLKVDELLPLYMRCVAVKKGDFEGLVRKATGLKGKALHAKLESMLEGIVAIARNDSSIAKVKP